MVLRYMKTLKVKEIPCPSGAEHPEPPNDILPRHEFTMGLIAPKGAGKTTLLLNLILFYKKYFHQIIIFSPTIKNDEKWDYITDKRLLLDNAPLRKVYEIINEKKKTKTTIIGERPMSLMQDIHATPEPVKTSFTGKIPEECFITEYDQATLMDIVHKQQTIVEFLDEHGYTKHTADRILIIFDDLVGSNLFSNRRNDPFKKLNTNHRHSSVSILMVSQAYREIPKTVRTNFTCLILFKIFNEKEKEAIHEEYPMDVQKDQWEQVYDYCTKEPHGFLYFNIKKPHGKRIMKSFDQVLFYKDD